MDTYTVGLIWRKILYKICMIIMFAGEKQKTSVQKSTLEPHWDEELTFTLEDGKPITIQETLEVTVKDKERIGKNKWGVLLFLVLIFFLPWWESAWISEGISLLLLKMKRWLVKTNKSVSLLLLEMIGKNKYGY